MCVCLVIMQRGKINDRCTGITEGVLLSPLFSVSTNNNGSIKSTIRGRMTSSRGLSNSFSEPRLCLLTFLSFPFLFFLLYLSRFFITSFLSSFTHYDRTCPHRPSFLKVSSKSFQAPLDMSTPYSLPGIPFIRL